MKYPEHSNDTVELHEEQPRGWYIPEEVKLLYDDTAPDGTRRSARVLNAEEMMLLSKINALCKRKQGCTASNRWLARWWGKSKDWVSKSIVRFESLGLLNIEVLPGNRRVLRTTFQGVPIAEKSDSYSRKVREGSDKNQMATDILEKTSKKRQLDASGCRVRQPIFGLGTIPRSEKYARQFAQFTVQHGWHLRQKGSTKTGWSDNTIKVWARSYLELYKSLKGDYSRVKRAMLWYFEHFKDKYVPECRTFRSFCSKFDKVEAAMDRKQFSKNGKHEVDDVGHGKRLTVQQARDWGWSEKQIRRAGLCNQ